MTTVIRKNKYSLLFILLTIIIFVMYYNKFYLAVDGQFHLSRINSLLINTNIGLEKQWMYPDLLNGFGYEMGIFYPDIFLYPIIFIAKIFHLTDKSTYVLTMLLMHVVSHIVFYLCIKYIMVSEKRYNVEALSLSALGYSFFPYKIVNYFVKMRMGENFIYIFIPIVILGLYLILKQRKHPEILAIGIAGVAYSNLLSVVSILIFVFFVTFIYIRYLDKQRIWLFVKSAMLTISLSSIIIFPIIEALVCGDYYIENYPKVFGWIFQNTIPISNYNINLIVSPIITIIFFCFIFKLIIKDKEYKKTMMAFMLVMVFISTNLFPWSLLETILPQTNILQFPWRFLAFVSAPFALLIGMTKYKKIIVPILCIGITFLTCMSINIFYNTIPYEETLIKFEKIYTTQIGKGEYLPQKLRTYIMEGNSSDTVEGVNENIDILKNSLSDDKLIIIENNKYEYTTKHDMEIELPIIYSRNYKIKINEELINHSESKNGLILLTAPSGDGTIQIDYIWTTVQIISSLISMATIVSMSIGFTKRTKRKDLV